MDLATFLIQCLNALQYGLLLFLVAAGLTLIFGIMGVINLAHGSFYMIGAYLAFGLAPLFGQNFALMLLAAVFMAIGILRFPLVPVLLTASPVKAETLALVAA